MSTPATRDGVVCARTVHATIPVPVPSVPPLVPVVVARPDRHVKAAQASAAETEATFNGSSPTASDIDVGTRNRAIRNVGHRPGAQGGRRT